MTGMNMLRLGSAILAAVFLARAVAADGQDGPRRLSADFKMTRTLKVLSDTIESRGKLTLGGAGLLRWEMTNPSRSLLVVNGGTAWIHYPDMGVTKGFDLSADPVMKVMSQHLLALTTGRLDRMGELYEVSDLGKDGVKGLLPLEPSVRKVFAQLRVKTTPTGVVEWVELVSAGGDTTRIEFSNVKLDPPLDSSLFEKP